jgi:16S rRNA (cytosine967-C5)-methyltransferase
VTAIHRHQLDAAADALGTILRFERPADAVLHEYFRKRPALGSHDRAFVAETTFGLLRHKRLIDQLVPDAIPRIQILTYLTRVTGISVRELAPLLKGDEIEVVSRVRGADTRALPPAVQADLPDWVFERLRARMTEESVLALARALQQPAPLDLRVNTVRMRREDAIEQLRASGIDCAATPFSPAGIRVKGKPAINRHPLFLDGSIEVQDEGSQLLAYLLAPRRGELVVDFCAGAGGKTLALAALMHSHGRVYAFDVSAHRLARLKPRLKRSGLSNIHPAVISNENDARVKRLASRINRVLVDAPCSGLGTLRRNPDLKWRQSPAGVQELKNKQTAILTSAARLVKPGGRLVYATCSLLVEENEEVVQHLLGERKDLVIVPAGEVLHGQRIALDTGTYLQLRPDIHGTDGFFAAVIDRAS